MNQDKCQRCESPTDSLQYEHGFGWLCPDCRKELELDPPLFPMDHIDHNNC